jgi:hypothetical protein
VAKVAQGHSESSASVVPAFVYVLKMEAVCVSETVVASYLRSARCCRCARAGCMQTDGDGPDWFCWYLLMLGSAPDVSEENAASALRNVDTEDERTSNTVCFHTEQNNGFVSIRGTFQARHAEPRPLSNSLLTGRPLNCKF